MDRAVELRALAARAFIWGYPLVRAAQLRERLTAPQPTDDVLAGAVASASLNSLGHARRLATPATRVGVAPNHDTLYSLAWLDLMQGPFLLETPDFGSRYYCFQMGQADSATEQSFGRRSHGSRLPPLFICGPDDEAAGPSGALRVRSRYRYLMVAGRILVDGEHDLPAVHALQDRIRLRPWGPRMAPPVEARHRPTDAAHEVSPASDPRLTFLDELAATLADIGLARQDQSMMEQLARIGLTPADGFRSEGLDDDSRESLAAGLKDGEARVRARTLALGRQVNGWSINDRGSDFGDDLLLRAAVAMDQIYIVDAQEALYPSARVDEMGATLDGRHRYCIRFAAGGLPPVDAFWSITLYFAQGFLVPNPINRWAIGDRTPGLVYSDDGELEICIQHERPDAPRANWLPAPPAPFMLLMRLYHPLPAVRNGKWVPPPVERVNP